MRQEYAHGLHHNDTVIRTVENNNAHGRGHPFKAEVKTIHRITDAGFIYLFKDFRYRYRGHNFPIHLWHPKGYRQQYITLLHLNTPENREKFAALLAKAKPS